MAKLTEAQRHEYGRLIQSHDFLRDLVAEIEAAQRLVFHSNENADWERARASAQQVLIAELVTRYRGAVERVYAALEDLQRRGREWPVAIRELAARIQSYYTTPLGMMIRAELFGEDAVFLSPDSAKYLAVVRGGQSSTPKAR